MAGKANAADSALRPTTSPVGGGAWGIPCNPHTPIRREVLLLCLSEMRWRRRRRTRVPAYGPAYLLEDDLPLILCHLPTPWEWIEWGREEVPLHY